MAKIEFDSKNIDEKKHALETTHKTALTTWIECNIEEEEAKREAQLIIEEARSRAQQVIEETTVRIQPVKTGAIHSYITAYDDYRDAYISFKTENGLTDTLLTMLGYPSAKNPLTENTVTKIFKQQETEN